MKINGKKIKQLRKEQGLTQLELSHIIGISNSLLQQYECGERNPKYDRLIAIANALGVNPEYLLDDPPPESELPIFFRIFRNHKGKFDEDGNLIFEDKEFFNEISSWFQQWKKREQAIKEAKNIEDETERSCAIEEAEKTYNEWVRSYPNHPRER